VYRAGLTSTKSARCDFGRDRFPKPRLTCTTEDDYFRIADHPGGGRSLTDQVELLRTCEVLFSSTVSQYRAEFVLLARGAARWFD
jgi:hypothetical protein